MQRFNAPPTTPSSVGTQFNNFYYQRKAIVDAKKDMYFSQLADVMNMPKNYGKTIKVYQYVPLLDDRNINNQGLDAAGAVIANGNLYGSSKDIGAIPSKLPTLTETGGRVNRVGFVRKEISGSFTSFGFFHEWTKEARDFDTDAELAMHVNRELMNGAVEMTEDALQIDLLNAAGLVRYAGAATTNATLDTGMIVTYSDLMRLSIDLDNNRTPKDTTLITGSRMTDTKTIDSARVMFVGSEMLPTLRAMKDLHNQPAFIPVRMYGDATTLLTGEVGTVDQFRIVVVPEMLKWAGAGATSSDASYFKTGTKYDVFPMLVVGKESFTTIGFQTDGKSVKFNTITKEPGESTATTANPYGNTGFSSIQWYYGFLAMRPERIAVVKTLAKM
jgi:N4-gp56 family major capsid protein